MSFHGTGRGRKDMPDNSMLLIFGRATVLSILCSHQGYTCRVMPHVHAIAVIVVVIFLCCEPPATPLTRSTVASQEIPINNQHRPEQTQHPHNQSCTLGSPSTVSAFRSASTKAFALAFAFAAKFAALTAAGSPGITLAPRAGFL